MTSKSIEQGYEAKIHCGFIREDDFDKILKIISVNGNLHEELRNSKEYSVCEEYIVRAHWVNKEENNMMKMSLKEILSRLGQ